MEACFSGDLKPHMHHSSGYINIGPFRLHYLKMLFMAMVAMHLFSCRSKNIFPATIPSMLSICRIMAKAIVIHSRLLRKDICWN